jgi:hypothetical protein
MLKAVSVKDSTGIKVLNADNLADHAVGLQNIHRLTLSTIQRLGNRVLVRWR